MLKLSCIFVEFKQQYRYTIKQYKIEGRSRGNKFRDAGGGYRQNARYRRRGGEH